MCLTGLSSPKASALLFNVSIYHRYFSRESIRKLTDKLLMQIVAMQVGPRNKQTAEKLFYKLPEPLKKKPSTILTSSLCTMKPSPSSSIDSSVKNQVRHVILKDLTARSDSDVRG
jgi:hypothetical protein